MFCLSPKNYKNYKNILKIRDKLTNSAWDQMIISTIVWEHLWRIPDVFSLPVRDLLWRNDTVLNTV